MSTTDRWKDVIGGRYRLVRHLGTGGMAEVYLAKAIGSRGFEKLVALKLLPQVETDRPENVDALQREALIGVHLDHDNVVQILDFGEDRGRYFVAMEYVRGFTLAHILLHVLAADERLPVRAVVHIVHAIADALQHVHGLAEPEGARLELIHGDVTPSNIMLSADGRIKLTDFGIAALAREIAGKGAVAGKPRYLPPEVLRGAPHTQQSDVYALGAVLYEALASAPAFPGKSPTELHESFEQGPVPISASRPDCPEPLADVVMRAIDLRPEARYASAKDLLRALDEAFARQVDDAECHRAFVSKLYASDEFVKSYGELPSTGSLGLVGHLAPHVTSQTGDLTPRSRRPPSVLRFGLSPALSSEVARQSGERLAKLLAERLSTEVRTIVFADYKTLVDCLSNGEVDFAWTPPQAFLEVFERGGGMLAIMLREGRITYESALFVRADSPIERIADLRGESAAWVDRRSASGHLFAFAELIRQLAGEEPLVQEHFHGSHRAVCEAVLKGWAGFGATYAMRSDDGELVTSGWTALVPDRADELRPLAFVGPIPADNIAHAPELPSVVVQELIAVLTDLHESEQGRTLLKEVLGADQLIYGGFELYRGLIVALETVEEHEGKR